MWFGVGGKRTTQTTVNSLDPQEQAWREKLAQATDAAANGGPGAGLTGANDYYKQMMGGGQLGMSALSGDANATQQLMNPYQQQVIDAMQKQWGNINQQTQNQGNAAATSAGAFGGSRGAIQNAALLSGNNIAQAGQTAGLLSSGFNDAMGRAGQLADMGYAGAGGATNLGMSGVGNPDLWRMMIQRGGMMGVPYGTSQGVSGSSQNYDAGFSLFGGKK